MFSVCLLVLNCVLFLLGLSKMGLVRLDGREANDGLFGGPNYINNNKSPSNQKTNIIPLTTSTQEHTEANAPSAFELLTPQSLPTDVFSRSALTNG